MGNCSNDAILDAKGGGGERLKKIEKGRTLKNKGGRGC
jgi:hypothetical protein